MTTKSEHVPPRIRREDFEAGHLKPGGYIIEDISAAIVSHLDRDQLTPRQLEALRRFKYQGTWSISQPDNIHNIRKFFEIFDDFFFTGLLRGHCTIELFKDTHLRVGRPVCGYCDAQIPALGDVRDPRYIPETVQVHIAIHISKKDTFAERIDEYIDILIHEILHAITYVYSYTYEHRRAEKLRAFLQGPWGGHGPAWLAAANSIEQRRMVADWADRYVKDEDPEDRSQHYLGLIPNFNRDWITANAVQPDGNLPIDSELRRLGLDFTEILDDLKLCRAFANASSRKEHMLQTLTWKTNRCIKSHWTVDDVR